MLSPKKKKRSNFLKRLTANYRLTVLKDESFEEKFSGSITPLKIFFFATLLIFILGVGFWFLYAHTPIKYSIPGYPHQEIINADLQNKIAADSLVRIAEANQLYYKNLKAILRGEKIEDVDLSADSTSSADVIMDYTISEADSLARLKIMEEENYDLQISENIKKPEFLENLLLFKPLEGVISDGVHFKDGHFGIDVSAPTDTRVKSILDGTVVFSGFTASGGNEIHIQHDYNLLSIYKHNSAVLKKMGEFVKAGESVSVVGNSGEHSDGTHLHFEMWQRGVPLDPELFFSF